MSDYEVFLAASAEDRRGVFLAAANRLRTAEVNVEKDFWVCWALQAMFHAMEAPRPRLLFKGGTSLSKGYGLISRFSEDVDVTVFRDDLGQAASVEELLALSGTKRKAKLAEIKRACQAYIAGPLQAQLGELLAKSITDAGIDAPQARVELDPDDPDRQTLLLWYPASGAARDAGAYVRPAVKIESGAKSALDPNRPLTVRPYVDDDLPDLDLSVEGVTTVDPERTFWDKVVIVHGQRRWFEKHGALKGGGQRVTRHYYDLDRLIGSDIGRNAASNPELGADCVAHARMFFNNPAFDLAAARPGTFALAPTAAMLEPLARDYAAMSGMIFGEAPSFEAVLESVAGLEHQLNGNA